MRVGAIRGLVVTGLLGTMTLGAIPPASAGTNDPSCFVAAINGARGSAGLASLAANAALAVIAQAWSGTMAAAGQISHNLNLPNVAPSDWMALGENVGVGPSCDSLAQAFMNSPEHKTNILDPAYSSVGVGVVVTAGGTVYVTEDFMGTASPAPAPVAAPKPAPAPVTQAAPAPAPTTPPAPAPVHTIKPVPAAVHTAPPAPVPPVPAPAPSPSPTPDPVVIPAQPIVLPEPSPQPSPVPADLTRLTANAHHGKHHHGGVLQAIGSLLAHLF